MELKDLYARYGELLVQKEMIDNAINQVKQALSEAIPAAQAQAQAQVEDKAEKEEKVSKKKIKETSIKEN